MQKDLIPDSQRESLSFYSWKAPTEILPAYFWIEICTSQVTTPNIERFLKYKRKEERVLEYRGRDIFCRLNSINLFYYTVGFI